MGLSSDISALGSYMSIMSSIKMSRTSKLTQITNDRRTLALRGDENIQFADVVRAYEGMTMLVMLGGGTRKEMAAPILLFMNPACSYPFQGVNYNVPCV